MNSSSKIKLNFVLKLIYQFVAILVPLITTPYLARVLGATQLGNYGYTYSIMIYFGLAAVFGFNIYGRREIAKVRDDKYQTSKVFFEIMIAKAIPSVISIGLYVLLAVLYKEFSILLYAFLPCLLYHLLDITFLVQGDENFKFVTLRDLLIKVSTIVLIFVLVKRPEDVWIYAVIVSGTQLVSGIAMISYLRNRIQKVAFKELKVFIHLKKAIMFLVPAVAASVFLYVDKIMIKLITGSSEEVAYYEEAIKIITMLTGITTSLCNVIEPRNAYEFANNNPEQAKTNVVKGITYSMVVCLPMLTGLICVAPIFVPIFFGPGFDTVSPILQILCILIPLISITEMIGTAYLIPSGREKLFTRIILISAGVNIALNFLFIWLMGAIGAAIGTIVSELVKATMLLVLIRKELKFKELIISLTKKIASTVVMLMFVLPMSILSNGSTISLIAIVLAGIILFFGVEYILQDKEFINMALYCIRPVLKLFKKKQNE